MRQVPYHDQDRTYQPDDPLNPNYDPTPQPTPSPTPEEEAPPVDPWATAPEDGNWERWFLSNIKGTAATPEALAALKDKLAKHGIQVLTNAEGIAGKIQLPDGTIVDVGRRFSGGDPSRMEWQWLTGSGTGGAPTGDWFDSVSQPEPYTAPGRPDHLKDPYAAPTFNAPTFDELFTDPGYQARLQSGVLARDRMASARGSILSGGHTKAIERYAQEFGANEYSDLYGRRYNAFLGGAGLDANARQMNEKAYQDDVMNAYNQYGQRYRTYRDAIGDQFRLAELGANATTAGAPQ